MKYIEDKTGQEDVDFVYEPTFECVLNHGSENDDVSLPSSISGSSRGGKRTRSMLPDEDDDAASYDVEATKEWLQRAYKEDSDRKCFRGVRRFILCSTILILIAFGLILFFAVSNSLANNGDRSNNFAEINEGPGAVSTLAPTIAAGAPVAASTEAPTAPLSPTAAPTPFATPVVETAAPTSTSNTTDLCFQDLITPEATCLTTAEPLIDIVFDNCQPQPDDWVGIWRGSRIMDPASLPEPDLWLWTCGTQNCTGAVSFGELAFGNLGIGTYEAHLVRLDTEVAPYTTSYATSSRFLVRRFC